MIRRTLKNATLVISLAISPTICHAQQILGQVYIDASASVLKDEVGPALSGISRQIPNIVKKLGIRQWELLHFTDDGWSVTPIYSINLPIFEKPKCEPSPPNEAQLIFKLQMEEKGRREKEACQNRVSIAWEKYESDLKNKILGFTKTLTPPIPDENSCTSVWDTLLRISLSQVPTLALVVSDGEETCRKQKIQSIPPPKTDARAILVLLSRRKETKKGMTAAEQFLEHRKQVLKIAPWMRVIPFWSLSHELIASGML